MKTVINTLEYSKPELRVITFQFGRNVCNVASPYTDPEVDGPVNQGEEEIEI